MLDLRKGDDVRDAFRAFVYAGSVIVGIVAITHIYPFNNALSLLVLSSSVLIGAIWIRVTRCEGKG
jgi:hypothetical protein